MKQAGWEMPEVIQMERTDPEDRNLKDMSNPKVLKSMNSSCKMVEVVTSPASPSHSTTSSTALKDTPRPNKEPSIEPTRRASHTGEDDVQSSAPTPCANTVILGKRPSRQRDSTNKRRRNEWGHESEDEDDKSVQSATANSASEKVDRTIVPDNRHKGPCSYELCPNPTHSSGGGFKIVTQDTKAGHRSWAKFVGRVFCNACFTQYATRGTFDRPGRQYGPASGSGANSTDHASSKAQISATDAAQLNREASRDSMRNRVVIPTAPLYRAVPCEVDVSDLAQTKADLGQPHHCVELSVNATGRNLRYQWFRDGQRIHGATGRSLLLRGPDQCRGSISCRLTNEYGQAPLFTPVRLPLSPEQALHKYGEHGNLKAGPAGPGEGANGARMGRDRVDAKLFRLQCVCGKERKGSPAELASVPCVCGKVCCGKTWPVTSDDNDAGLSSVPGSVADVEAGLLGTPGLGMLQSDMDANQM
mmetsp:Transcript_42785/g.100574  ORF Transcript_42785/g.100574 Transcript_42785/m.100574 type:complete len:474 (+) Transcript_42785:210-1631(+)